MWLLDTTTGKLHYIADPSRENYAILSHVWITGKEQSFQQLQALHVVTAREAWGVRLGRLAGRAAPSPLAKASEKIRECCAFAKARGYRWLWVDTCCIDKTSSAELSEAINSMYQWYAQAGVCYAFLHDVSDEQDPRVRGSQFRQSRWFRRGWTLQELIAPRELVFISKEWRPFGTKTSLADVVEEVSGVERAILGHTRPLSTVSVARRMAWFAKRKTTRVEDEAYSLMGIFGVNIPTIYGEGRNAFYRLQEEILRHTPDQSIFAWGPLVFERYAWSCDQFLKAPLPETTREDTANEYLFAPSPTAFEHSGGITPLPLDDFERELSTKVPVPEYTITSYGIRTQFPLATLWRPVPLSATHPQLTVHVAVLACTDANDGLVALLLRSPLDQNHEQYQVGCRYPAGFVRGATLRCLQESLALSPSHSMTKTPSGISSELASVYIPYRPFELPVESYATRHNIRRPPTENGGDTPARSLFLCPCEVIIPQWTVAHLLEAGYSISAAPSADRTVVHVPRKGPLVCVVLTRRGDSYTNNIHIGLAPCPVSHSSFVPPHLTALVSFKRPPVHPEVVEGAERSVYRPRPMSESCKRTHVQEWRDSSAEFVSKTGIQVKLTFGAWTDYMDSGNNRGLYALTIELENSNADSGEPNA